MLEEKIEAAKVRLRSYPRVAGIDYRTYIGHSGGKDSCVITHLMDLMWPHVPIVHNPKPTATHPHTKQFLYNLAATRYVHFVAEEDMKQFCTFYRFGLQIDGTRRAEFDRTDRSNLVMVNGKEVNRADMPEFIPDGRFGLKMLYPIVDWTDDDVWEYIVRNNISISEEYKGSEEWLRFIQTR